jgi:molybdopterin-containing oxidoreductase family membrane subunit
VLLAAAIGWLLWRGIGVWGNNVPHVWGFDLIAYAWWIGVANAASLFAAVLVLRRHGLRTAVNRFAEALALAAVLAAALYPILHLGRPFLFYWTLPYPATFQVWPQFGSALVWDFWGISAHVLVTTLFWYVGLIPDLATLRDRAAMTSRLAVARAYGLFALGWRGSVAHWHRHQAAYRLVAAMVLPLLLSAQTVVALEFAVTMVPDWHQARLPLHFVATGLPSGLGLVAVLAVALRHGLGLRGFIDAADIDLLGRLLACSAIAGLAAWAHEAAAALLQEDAVTRAAFLARLRHPAWWVAVTLAGLLPQLLWRWRNDAALVLAGLVAALGVWFDRWSLIVDGRRRSHLPFPDPAYAPGGNEWALLAGAAGLFAFALLLFARFLPAVSMFETRHEESAREAAKEER